jgi:DNA-binding MarR family transcriptional regulator
MDIPREPRWLDAEEQQAWIALSSVLVRLPAALDAQLQRNAGISHFEFQVLSALSRVPDRTLRLSQLAMLAEGSLSRLSNVVSRLEKRGWVRRTPDSTDGRYTLGILTDEGWVKVVDTAPRAHRGRPYLRVRHADQTAAATPARDRPPHYARDRPQRPLPRRRPHRLTLITATTARAAPTCSFVVHPPRDRLNP